MNAYHTQPTKPLTNCYEMHKVLCTRAMELFAIAERPRPERAAALRVAASCISIASNQALAARTPQQAAIAWRQCDRGDRALRSATYQLLNVIGDAGYDGLFAAAAEAARARRDELLRLRRQMHFDSFI